MACYQRKPEIVEAIQYDGKNTEEVEVFFGYHEHKQYIPTGNGLGYLEMRGGQGYIFATPGDMIVKSNGGQIVNVKAPAFLEAFDIVTEGNV